MEERWADVPDFEESYEVSDHGRVRSKDRIDASGHFICGKIRKLQTYHGYHYVGLTCGKKYKMAKVARLVAMCFVEGRSEENNTVNHKDENRSNDIYTNLEWCSMRYNVLYNNGIQRRWNTRIKTGANVPNPSRAVEAWKDGVFIKRMQSLTEAAKFCNRTKEAIFLCCRGKTKQSGGYQWRYAEK